MGEPEAPALILPQCSSQLLLHPTAQRPLEAARQPPLHVQDGDGPLQAAAAPRQPPRGGGGGGSTQKQPLSHTPYLQPPDAGALLGGLLHGAVHQGDEHVEEQDVGEDDVADEEHVEDLLVLVVLGELHVAHADGELKELHRGVGDVSVADFEATRAAVVFNVHPAGWGAVWWRLDEQSDHRWDKIWHIFITALSEAMMFQHN